METFYDGDFLRWRRVTTEMCYDGDFLRRRLFTTSPRVVTGGAHERMPRVSQSLQRTREFFTTTRSTSI